ncbi:glycosyltransferase family 2 protein [bacterium]|nr:glycosyltransferase family 2 protein [candidate division CSSED10-310 bacterium]
MTNTMTNTMNKKYSLSMVFPAYNEQDNVEKLVKDADSIGKNIMDDRYEIIVVDDGSKDHTPAILNRLKTEYPHLVVYTHSPNRGYTAALRTGFTQAKMDLIFYSDADNQFDLTEIPLLLDRIGDNDIVSGYRNPRIDPWLRIFVSRCFNVMSHTIFRFPIRDVDCAFKLFRREVFDKITITSDNFMVDTEIMAKAVLFGMRVAEVGVTHLPRCAGKTTVKPSDVFKTLRGMYTLWFELKEMKKNK